MGFFSELLGTNEISAACGSSVGRVRENNEDNFYFDGRILSEENGDIETAVFVPDDEDARGGFFAVFDGMGGAQYGELASHDAAEYTRQFFLDEDNFNPWDVTPTLTKLCLDINRKVYESGRALGVSVMGTTVAALYFFEDMVWSCNVGDSRCYRLRNGELELLSEDHVEDMFETDMEKKKKKPGLIQFLGMDPDEVRLEPTVASSFVKDGDIYLVCSDGLTDMVEAEDICAILEGNRKPRNAVSELIRTAEENGGRDNITVIVCRQH
jgi:protein phosphatase